MKKITSSPATGKRRHRRYYIHEANIRMYTNSIFNLTKREIPKTILINLSRSGFQTVSLQPVVVEDAYAAVLDVPVIGEFYAKVQAVWCRPFRKEIDGQYYRSGFIFTELSETDWGKISSIDNAVHEYIYDPTRHWGYISEESEGISVV